MGELADESINIVVTSPPYPMVEMWDDIFAMQNKAIACNLADNPSVSFDLMHGILNNIYGGSVTGFFQKEVSFVSI